MRFLVISALASQFAFSSAFVPSNTNVGCRSTIKCNEATTSASGNMFDSFLSIFKNDESEPSSPNKKGGKFAMAQSLVLSLINDDKCFSTVEGAQKFADSCAVDVVYEDCYEPQPIVGRGAVAEHLRARILARTGGENGDRDAGFRVDKISDGSTACGFAWTWTSSSLEGLRGTTFVELSSSNQIQYIREIPEPLYKPGDLILEVLKAATADATPKPPPEYTPKTPKKANEIAKYLFNDVQGADPEEGMRFFDESIIYRDFNYEEVLKGKAEVKKFIEDFSFPGITFSTQRFDDGVASTCFTWEVVLEGAPEGSTIKGISFYEVNPETGLITYVRDVPESGIKPPPLGKLARQFRPAVGVFQPVAIGSREGGL
eukprot:CAMPEP_0172315886 /NCGR_PEP_ID=MMETSP1058-20130122/26564_1 /TAXON_ID=83371 /ORGANISM="Detonula confervacea, Strain CCMP 353" /LENGTH=372 /DNA_ID=CAMNT_0013030071 /DNA_START=143 /DNA_END=1261 /DNA_ORIENTATION=-